MTRPRTLNSNAATAAWDDAMNALANPAGHVSVPMSNASKVVLCLIALGMGLVMGGILNG